MQTNQPTDQPTSQPTDRHQAARRYALDVLDLTDAIQSHCGELLDCDDAEDIAWHTQQVADCTASLTVIIDATN